VHGAHDSSSFILLHEHSKGPNYLYKLSGKRLSGKPILRIVRESDCPGNVRYPTADRTQKDSKRQLKVCTYDCLLTSSQSQCPWISVFQSGNTGIGKSSVAQKSIDRGTRPCNTWTGKIILTSKVKSYLFHSRQLQVQKTHILL